MYNLLIISMMLVNADHVHNCYEVRKLTIAMQYKLTSAYLKKTKTRESKKNL